MHFLGEVARHITQAHPEGLQNVCVVWPNRRSGYLFQESFKTIDGFKGFLPEVFTIDELAEEISSVKVTKPIDLRCLFYETYLAEEKLTPKENFINFLSWGDILLSDFDQIDFHLAPANQIFSYLKNLKDIDHWSKTFGKKESLKERYLKQWQFYYPLYEALQKRMEQHQQGYRGFVYKHAAIKAPTFWQQTEKKWYFAGFNALNRAEELIISEGIQSEKAQAYWDFDPYFTTHKEYEAGFFIKKIIQNKTFFPQGFTQQDSHFSKPKSIEVRAVSGQVAQAKNLGSLLNKLQNENTDLTQTTVILPDENQLIPVLNALPESLTQVNITMGYPVHNRPSVQFFKKLISWWQLQKEGKEIHFTELKEVCEWVIAFCGDAHFKKILETLQSRHQIFYRLDSKFELLHNIPSQLAISVFSPEKHPELFSYLTAVLDNCRYQLETTNTGFNIVKEELFKIHNTLNQLKILTGKYPFLNEGKLLATYFEDIMSQQSLSFRGEPNKGLQIMGMLESRNLDYDNVIFLSANEGMLPPESSRNSLLPFEVRLAFGLPKLEESDALYAYHFYRLISKAKKIYFFYNANMANLGASEPSRYIKQLELNSPHKVIYKNVAPLLQPQTIIHRQLTKDTDWMETLSQRAQAGLSPSLLTTYIYNPWKFYESYILGISEETEVEETLSERNVGNVIHKVLEEVYARCKNSYLRAEDFTFFLKSYPQHLEKAFELNYPGGNMNKGKNILIKEVIKKQVERMIHYDLQELKKGHRLFLIDVEKKFNAPLSVEGVPFQISLKGIVDRIDRLETPTGEYIRIIDYKTGSVEPAQLMINDFSQLIEDYKYSKAFQLLVYALALKDHFELPMQAGIISFKKFGNGLMNCKFEDNETIINTDTLNNFKVVLNQLIAEIFNPEIPIIEKL